MAMKTTGAEFKAFCSDDKWWPEGTWHEDEEVTVNGEYPPEDFDLSSVEDCAQLVLSGGRVANKKKR